MIKMKKVDLAPKDVLYILRWPDACVSCGTSKLNDINPEYIIKRTGIRKQVDGVDTTFWYRAVTKLYLCMDCRKKIITAKNIPSKGFRGHGDSVEKLLADPYGSFFNLNNNCDLVVAEGPFLDQFARLNPGFKINRIKNPLEELLKKLPKDAEIVPASMEEVSAWEPPQQPKDKDGSKPEEPEKIKELRKRLADEPELGDNWMELAKGLVSVNDCRSAAITVFLAEQAFNHFTLDLETVQKLRQYVETCCGDLRKAMLGR